MKYDYKPSPISYTRVELGFLACYLVRGEVIRFISPRLFALFSLSCASISHSSWLRLHDRLFTFTLFLSSLLLFSAQTSYLFSSSTFIWGPLLELSRFTPLFSWLIWFYIFIWPHDTFNRVASEFHTGLLDADLDCVVRSYFRYK